jgi:PilZ domain-containing protein
MDAIMQVAQSPDAWEEPVEERRESHRSRTLRGGKVLFNDRRSVLDCMIRNVSPEGACLQVESLVGVPPDFELLIDGEEAPRPCRLVWQSHDRAGVEFGPSQSEAPTNDPPHARVAAPRAGSDLRQHSRDGAGSSGTTGRSRSW